MVRFSKILTCEVRCFDNLFLFVGIHSAFQWGGSPCPSVNLEIEENMKSPYFCGSRRHRLDIHRYHRHPTSEVYKSSSSPSLNLHREDKASCCSLWLVPQGGWGGKWLLPVSGSTQKQGFFVHHNPFSINYSQVTFASLCENCWTAAPDKIAQ